MVKELLQTMTREAYEGDEMSLLSAIHPRKWDANWRPVLDEEHFLTDAEAMGQPAGWYRTMFDIIKHVADCKFMYMTQAYGAPAEPPPSADDLASLLSYLQASQDLVTKRLEEQTDEALARPVPTTFHGESGAHLFWVLAQHDVCHGSQIEALRGWPMQK